MTVLTYTSRSPLPAGAPPLLRRPSDTQTAYALIGAAILVGLALRIAAATGDLWLDELWSLDLVSRLTSPDQVFWKISHDNNHFLNSLWMYLVGQHQAPIVYRLPSVVCSTLAIVVAARIGWRINIAAAVAAAWIACCSYTFVDYGSEARGYGGLILAILVAIDVSRRQADQVVEGKSFAALTRKRWTLALIIMLGACAHLTMMAEAVILGLATILRLKPRESSYFRALDQALVLFRPSLLLLLPVFACLGIGILAKGEFAIGGSVPFTVERFVAGYGGLLDELLGLRTIASPWMALLVTGCIVLIGFAARLLDRRWGSLAFVALVLWPGLVLAAHIGNTEYARYFLASGLFLPIFLAEIVGRLWSLGGLARWCSVALVAGLCGGQIGDLATLITVQRGSPAAAIAFVGSEGPTRFKARNPFITEPVVSYFAQRDGFVLTPADLSDPCGKPPEWVVYDSDFGEAVPSAPEVGPAACRSRFIKQRAFPAALWSGRSWTVYRRER